MVIVLVAPVCMSVCLHVFHFPSASTSLGDTDQVRIWRSSGQGQEHSSSKREIPYSHNVEAYRQSVGKNSRSIASKAVKFACHMGLSAMADGMVWPPSLSPDQKYTHFRVVWLTWECKLVILVICIFHVLLWHHSVVQYYDWEGGAATAEKLARCSRPCTRVSNQ